MDYNGPVLADEGARRSGTLAAFTAGVMIAAQVGGKATRDAVFLSVFDAAELPKAMLAAALLSAFGVLLITQGLARFGPARLVPLLFVVSAATFVLEWVLTPRFPEISAVVIYLHVAVLGSLLISGFWSVVSERFDPHSAKKLIGRINAGAALGGLAGGVVAERVAARLDARTMLLCLAAMHFCAAVGLQRAARGAPTGPSSGASVLDGLRSLRETPYLRLLGTLVALAAIVSGAVDFAFKAEADATVGSRESLMSLFAVFYTATSLVTVVLQTAVSRRALERLGIGGTIALLPGAVLIGGGLSIAIVRLPILVLLAGAEQVLSNSLYRSGYELLFTPLSPARKRPTKTLIDVGFDRLGGALGSGLVLAALAVFPRAATLGAVALGVAAAAAMLAVAARLHAGYVDELARSLRTGKVQLEDTDVLDATTRRTLADTTMALDREQLLREIDALRKEQGGMPPSLRAPVSLPAAPESERGDPYLSAVLVVLSGEPARIRRGLKRPLDPRLVAQALPFLGTEAYGRTARRALVEVAPRVVGQLVDALLDPGQPRVIRRRLADILARCPGPRAALGLFEALHDGPREVRERAARALGEVVRARPELAPERHRVLALADAELAALDDDPASLRYLLRLLSLASDTETFELSLAALRSEDATLRGTSFEYLENVLPEGLRLRLWPRIEEFARSIPPPPPSERRRSQRELADELHRSRAAIHLDPERPSEPPDGY